MKVNPHQLDLWSSQMGHFYNAIEGEIIRMIIDRLNSNHNDIHEWQADKMNQLHLFNRDIVKMVSSATPYSEERIKQMIEATGIGTIEDIDKAMPYDPKPMPSGIDDVMRGYFNQVWSDIDNYVNQTLITTNYKTNLASRAYVDVLNRTQALFNTGILTQNQALERAIRELSHKGIRTTLTDKGGHTWSLERYVRTVLKSTLGNTYRAVKKERMGEYGVYTVVVTSHIGARQQCSLIQGNVVDLRMPSQIPKDSEYKSIYDVYWGAEYGTAGGHCGVNCRHDHIPFVPGVNVNNQPKYDLKENAKVAKARDKQRLIERQIVKLKKNRMISKATGHPEGAKEWNKKIRAKQKQIAKHIEEHSEYLRRDYSREKVYTPLEALIKEFEANEE